MDRLARNGLTEKMIFKERHDDSKGSGPADLGGEHQRGRKSKYRHVLLRPYLAWLMKSREKDAAEGRCIRRGPQIRDLLVRTVFDSHPKWDGGACGRFRKQDYSVAVQRIYWTGLKEKRVGGQLEPFAINPGRAAGDQDQGDGYETVEKLLNYEISWQGLVTGCEKREEPRTACGVWPEKLKERDGH